MLNLSHISRTLGQLRRQRQWGCGKTKDRRCSTIAENGRFKLRTFLGSLLQNNNIISARLAWSESGNPDANNSSFCLELIAVYKHYAEVDVYSYTAQCACLKRYVFKSLLKLLIEELGLCPSGIELHSLGAATANVLSLWVLSLAFGVVRICWEDDLSVRLEVR